MPHEIRVPRLGWSMEEGTFLRWLKNRGDLVKPGEVLYELESDKATQEIEAVDGGVLYVGPDAPPDEARLLRRLVLVDQVDDPGEVEFLRGRIGERRGRRRDELGLVVVGDRLERVERELVGPPLVADEAAVVGPPHEGELEVRLDRAQGRPRRLEPAGVVLAPRGELPAAVEEGVARRHDDEDDAEDDDGLDDDDEDLLEDEDEEDIDE